MGEENANQSEGGGRQEGGVSWHRRGGNRRRHRENLNENIGETISKREMAYKRANKAASSIVAA